MAEGEYRNGTATRSSLARADRTASLRCISTSLVFVLCAEYYIQRWTPSGVLPLLPFAFLAHTRFDMSYRALSRGTRLTTRQIEQMDRSKSPTVAALSAQFYIVNRGLPDPPYACVPLSPTSPHPRGRPHIPVSAPLPWSDCYVSTQTPLYAMVTRIHDLVASPPCIADKDHFVIDNAASQDEEAMWEESQAKERVEIEAAKARILARRPSQPLQAEHAAASTRSRSSSGASTSIASTQRAAMKTSSNVQLPTAPLESTAHNEHIGALPGADASSSDTSSDGEYAESVDGPPQAMRAVVEVWMDLDAHTVDLRPLEEIGSTIFRLYE